jgi:hypothetical protein
MRNIKDKKESFDAIQVSVTKEMAEPRMARSARIAQLKLDTSRRPEPASITVPGTVDKIIPPSAPRKPEKAQIDVDGAERTQIRIENALTDEHGDDVKLKKGAQVDVTVAATKRQLLKK